LPAFIAQPGQLNNRAIGPASDKFEKGAETSVILSWRCARGIHQGDIFVDDGDTFVDGVNMAACLELSAAPSPAAI
jgi:class 3 adenylate cyclase